MVVMRLAERIIEADKSDLTARVARLSLDTTTLFLGRRRNFVKKFELVEL